MALSSNAFQCSNFAYYTQTTEEVIYDIVMGNNQSPSLSLSQKIIEIHRTIKPDLYRNILKKIMPIQMP